MENSTWQRLLLQSKRATNKSTINKIQNPIGIAGGVVQNALNTIVTGEVLNNTGLDGLTLAAGTLKYTRYWRYRLLLKGDNGMEKSSYNPRPSISPLGRAYLNESDNLHTTRAEDLSPNEKVSSDVDKIKARRSSKSFVPAGRDYAAKKFKALESMPNERLNDIFIINDNVAPYISLKLQNRPDSIDINPHGTWAAVQSMGRNNPFMMYTGGEDTVSFEISWYASDNKHRDEVLMKCKLLESWCKADGYNAAPPVLRIKWGSSGLFDNCYFILESALYRLTHFQDKVKSNGTIQDLHLYPNCATQQLTFKRVSMTNTVYEDIIPYNDVPYDRLRGINGVSIT